MFGHHCVLVIKKNIASIVIFAFVVVIFSSLIVIAFSNSRALIIQNSAKITVVGLDAYGGDIHSINGAFSVDLGTIEVGSSKSVSFYLRSVSNVPTFLDFKVNNWQPESIASFMSVSWNYSGNQLVPNEEIHIGISINTAATIEFVQYLLLNHVTSFSFNLSIVAVQSLPSH